MLTLSDISSCFWLWSHHISYRPRLSLVAITILSYHVSKCKLRVCVFSARDSRHGRVYPEAENSGSSRSGGGLGPRQDPRAAGRWRWDTKSKPKTCTILLPEGFCCEKLLEEVSSVHFKHVFLMFYTSLNAETEKCVWDHHYRVCFDSAFFYLALRAAITLTSTSNNNCFSIRYAWSFLPLCVCVYSDPESGLCVCWEWSRGL